MEKEKLKTVGAGALKSAHSSKTRQNNGITLIALVITIIVMLILVAVTISMAVNGGLFEYAQSAGRQTNEAKDAEQLLASGQVNIDNVVYNSIDEYINGTKVEDEEEEDGDQTITGNNGETFSAIYETNTPITQNGYTAIIPAGFAVGTSEGINTINDGLVIRDAQGNEFVWIPVTKELDNSYVSAEGYLEPAEVELDEGKGYNFTSEYQAMVSSVNTNNGFYIGRYETTTDANSNIGSKYNTQILASQNWYTLYETHKTASVLGNGTNVQTAMMYGVLWDETMAFITQKDTNYNVNSSITGCSYYGGSAVCYAGMTNTADEGLNIWGLASSYLDWTQESAGSVDRVCRGHITSGGAAFRYGTGAGYYTPANQSRNTFLRFSLNNVCIIKFKECNIKL